MSSRSTLGRLARRAGALAVVGATLAAPGAAASTYPTATGNRFDSNGEGWRATQASCTSSVSGSVCKQSSGHSTSDGNPPGSIHSRTHVVVNAADTFRGSTTLRSPSFTAARSGGAVLTYDRQMEAEGLLALSHASTVTPWLIDESTGAARSLAADENTSTDEAFARRRVNAPSLVAGRRYHLELRVATTTSLAREGVVGDLMVRFDNVALRVDDGLTARPAGASASAGVRFTGATLSSRAFASLASRIRWAAEVGRRSGGSVVPLSRCTIIGTPRSDRIRGSRGNDVICGMGGNDRINGGRGRDIIDGGNGRDRLQGASGGDVLAGLRGRDRASGGRGADRVGGGAGRDILWGRSGNDRLHGGSAFDRLSGGPGADRLISLDRRRDRLHGGRGRDRGKIDKRRRGARRRADRRRSLERPRR
jgi:RTX calcium-binding nonapeptide repeat (4 copies)